MLQTKLVREFKCIGAECPDTCCKGWSMQVDAATFERYKTQAPELLDAVVEGQAGIIMRRNPVTDYCVKFTDGLCGTQNKFGSDLLSDACHFYPRVTRKLAGEIYMTSAFSCPETARMALAMDDPFASVETHIDRLPHEVKEYTTATLAPNSARPIHEAFLKAAQDETVTPERVMSRIVSVAMSLQNVPHASWAEAAPFYIKSADARLAPIEKKDVDPFNLLHALMGLASAAGSGERPRLRKTIAEMEQALAVTLDWKALQIRVTEESVCAHRDAEVMWHKKFATAMQPVLRRWIQAQLSLAHFPFAGFGPSPQAKAVVLGVRFATMRLALMCACKIAGKIISQEDQIRVMQSLSRLLDHLADPALSLKIYEEPGWFREGRLRALMGDQ